jgi:hypothetical protein
LQVVEENEAEQVQRKDGTSAQRDSTKLMEQQED